MHVCVEVQTGEHYGKCVEVTGQSQVLTPTLLEKNLFDVCLFLDMTGELANSILVFFCLHVPTAVEVPG